jgi:hypothetical protein
VQDVGALRARDGLKVAPTGLQPRRGAPSQGSLRATPARLRLSAKKDPAKALELYAKLAEFHLPKLSRSTVDGDLGIRGKLVISG